MSHAVPAQSLQVRNYHPDDGDDLLELSWRSAPWGTDDWDDDTLDDSPMEEPLDGDTADDLDSDDQASTTPDEEPDYTSALRHTTSRQALTRSYSFGDKFKSCPQILPIQIQLLTKPNL